MASPYAKSLDEFADKNSEDFMCTICLGVPLPSCAVEAICCGSFFCNYCLDASRRQKQICPNCNGSFSNCPPRIVPTGNKFAHKKLLGLLIQCESRFSESSADEEKCEWRGAWADNEAHLARCEHASAKCAWNRCRVVASRKVLRAHEPACEFRTVMCEFCSSHHPFYELQQHHRTCAKFPVECTCGERGLKREELLYHSKWRCPDALIACDVAGCPEKVKLREFETHTKSCGYRKVSCSLCSTQLPINSLPRHYGVECPAVVVNCPLACGVGPIKRCDVISHLSTCHEDTTTSPSFSSSSTSLTSSSSTSSIPSTSSTSVSSTASTATTTPESHTAIAMNFHNLYQQIALLKSQVNDLSSTLLRHERTIADLTSQNSMLQSSTNSRQTIQNQ